MFIALAYSSICYNEMFEKYLNSSIKYRMNSSKSSYANSRIVNFYGGMIGALAILFYVVFRLLSLFSP